MADVTTMAKNVSEDCLYLNVFTVLVSSKLYRLATHLAVEYLHLANIVNFIYFYIVGGHTVRT